MRDNKEKGRNNMMEMKFLFVFTFLQLIQVFVNN